ncbi:HNH endonuclease family protein [Serratia fonticola]|uniref:hypothetical protein n=1 Tax=Serratia fonticola TaxID=47917 RepID=UPI0008FEE0A6|nr:hypothetical protein [Serratia fonticola]
MIKLIKCKEPDYLVNRSANWLLELNKAIDIYGSYESIPEKEKESLVAHYRHNNIKSALFPTSYNKCAFCECIPDEGGNFVQVEHFYPKSLYPIYCFDWDNFLPCCGKCNLAKSNLDTFVNPIINPYKDDPSDHLYVSLLRIKSKPDSIIGWNSVKELRLNGSRLINARRNLLGNIENLIERVGDQITKVVNAPSSRTRDNRLAELSDLVDELELLMCPSHAYSFFCKEIILSEPEYSKAKALL